MKYVLKKRIFEQLLHIASKPTYVQLKLGFFQEEFKTRCLFINFFPHFYSCSKQTSRLRARKFQLETVVEMHDSWLVTTQP